MINFKRVINHLMSVSTPVLLLAVFSTGLAQSSEEHDKHEVNKVKKGLSVMVLGSGGPVATPVGRASAGYLIFTDGYPRVLMDVGGGTFQRLARSGVNIKDLELVLLSHLHIDHTGDLSSVIKTIYFHNNQARTQDPSIPGRTAPVHIYGPASTAFPDEPGGKFPGTDVLQYPATTDYADGHYSVPLGGVERYLKAFAPAISAGASTFDYRAHDLNSNWMLADIETVYESKEDGLLIEAIAVNHGPVPAVAFRISYKGKSVVYSGDTSSKTENMIHISRGADLLIYDTAITKDLPPNPVFHALHTEPERIGEVAAAANVKKLILSHITPVTDPRIAEVKQAIRAQGYTGKIKTARDLAVYNLHRGRHSHKGRHD